MATPKCTSIPIEEDREAREARDAFVSGIARRLIASQPGKRHTQTQLRTLPFPLWIGGKRCLVAVHAHYVLSRPRSHVTETFWFETATAALKEFPHARVSA